MGAEAVEDGHLEIEKNQVVRPLLSGFYCLLAIKYRGDVVVPQHLEDTSANGKVDHIVVYQQDPQWVFLMSDRSPPQISYPCQLPVGHPLAFGDEMGLLTARLFG